MKSSHKLMGKLTHQSVSGKMKAAASTVVFHGLFNWWVGDNGNWTEDIHPPVKALFRTEAI